jgi:hypothetical protein
MAAMGATGAVVAMGGGGVTVWDTACPRRHRDVKQAYAKMSAIEKETLKQRMVQINETGASNEENMPPSLTSM